MLDILITSKTRVKLLVKFFENPETTSYLRELAEEFNESTNAIRVELNRLVQANLLTLKSEGFCKLYQANTHHEYYNNIHEIVLKMTRTVE